MSSETEIANRALSMLGDTRITALTDDTKGARAMNARFIPLRDALLQEYPWRFAVTLVQLPAVSTAPAFGYSQAYQLPADCLRPIEVGDNLAFELAVGVQYRIDGTNSSATAPYEIVGDQIHTDETAPLKFSYVARIENTGLFPPVFVEAFAARLAMDAAEELTQSAGKYDRAARAYSAAMNIAMRTDALQRPPQERMPGTWMTSRLVS